AHTRSLEIHSDLPSGCVQIDIEFPHGLTSSTQVNISVLDGAEAMIDSSTSTVQAGESVLHAALRVPKPDAWSTNFPYLYTVRVTLTDGPDVLDTVSKLFGFRTIEARDGKLYLNGEVIYLRAVLDQDYYPETIYTTPSDAFLQDQFTKAKDLGINCLRCHIKAADPRYYELADQMGFLIWTEIPNWGILSSRSKKLGRELFEDILTRDGHHPSIIAWTIINEDWGTDLVHEPSHRIWLKEMYHWVKEKDPTRLVIDNSPCTPNFHIESDIEDYHFYCGIPDHRREWDAFLKSFAARAPYTYSPHGDIVRTGHEPLIVSEFGNWGLPDIDVLKDSTGRDPWWFNTGLEWSEGVVYPQGVKTRFNNLGLGRVFGTYQSFTMETQKQEFLALKYQIEAMRLRPEIQGYVITELTDVHWECNGLLDMNRNPKIFFYDMDKVNAGTVVIPEWEQTAYSAGETVRIGVSIAHGSGKPLQGAEVSWKLEGGIHTFFGSAMVPVIHAGSVKRVGLASFAAPEVDAPCQQRFVMELHAKDGALINTNYVDFTLYPRRKNVPDSIRDAAIFTVDGQLAYRLRALGYSVTTALNLAQIAVAASADQALLDFVQSGGRLLLLADRLTQPGKVFPGILAVARSGTPWDGDWASTFTWLQRSGLFSRFPGGPLIDHSFDCVIPEYVLTGFKDWDYQRTVRSGIVVGWVHKPGVLIGEKDYGKGKVVFNTFNLTDEALSSDATAIRLLDALLELVGKGLIPDGETSIKVSTGTAVSLSS
ncbi:MAG: glycoside hydrolase family 2, partial [Chloroflexi bacterium]